MLFAKCVFEGNVIAAQILITGNIFRSPRGATFSHTQRGRVVGGQGSHTTVKETKILLFENMYLFHQFSKSRRETKLNYSYGILQAEGSIYDAI